MPQELQFAEHRSAHQHFASCSIAHDNDVNTQFPSRKALAEFEAKLGGGSKVARPAAVTTTALRNMLCQPNFTKEISGLKSVPTFDGISRFLITKRPYATMFES